MFDKYIWEIPRIFNLPLRFILDFDKETSDIERSNLAPGFLVAMPQLNDPNFYKSVVLLLENSVHGSMGLVINGPLSQNVMTLCDTLKIEASDKNKNEKLMLGGPVSVDRCFILHEDYVGAQDSLRVSPDIFITYTLDGLIKILKDDEIKRKIILGYAGWSADQLENEIKTGSWLTLEYDSEIVYSSEYDGIWETCIKRLGINPKKLFEGTSSVN